MSVMETFIRIWGVTLLVLYAALLGFILWPR